MRGVGVKINYIVTVVNAVADGSGGFRFAFGLLWVDYGWAGYCEGCWNWKRGHDDWRVVILVCGRWWCILASLIHVKITQSVSLSPGIVISTRLFTSPSFLPLGQIKSSIMTICLHEKTYLDNADTYAYTARLWRWYWTMHRQLLERTGP